MKLRTLLAIAALAAATPGPAIAQEEPSGAVLGSGSTFAYPILAQWAQAFQRAQRDAEFQPIGRALDYEPIGSQAGIMRLREAAVDFGATDMPLGTEELSRYGLGQFPFVIGGVVAAVNLDGVKPGALKLDGEVLARIFLGEITRWADPAVKALNPDLPLPDAPIAVIRRADGSGTTYNFTHFLSGAHQGFREKVGAGLLVKFPVGTAVDGNERVAQAIRATKNAIGYVIFAQARREGLAYAALRNRSGAFIEPSPEAFQAAAASADWNAQPDFGVLLADAPGEKAYPIVATTFAAMPKQSRPSKRALAAFAFFRWSLDNGSTLASELGYVPLPAPLVEKVKGYWATTFRAPG